MTEITTETETGTIQLAQLHDLVPEKVVKTIGDIYKRINKEHTEAIKTHDRPKLEKLVFECMTLLNEVPEVTAVIFTLATLFLHLGFYGVAIQLYKRCIYYSPHYPEAWNNIGSAYRMADNLDEARVHFLRAVELLTDPLNCERMKEANPKFDPIKEKGEVLNNIGTISINNGDPADAIRILQEAITILPDNPQPKWNLGLALLETGDMSAWEFYDAGLFSGDRPLKKYMAKNGLLPMWDGTPGKALVVYDEQGLGDRILFANTLRNLKDICPNIVLDCHNRLETMYRKSFNWIKNIYPTAKDSDVEWAKEIEADAFISTASLPKFFWKSISDIDRTPYVKVDEETFTNVKAHIESLGSPPYIGVAWHGGIQKTHTRERSVKLSTLAPIILSRKDCTFISCQYTADAQERSDKFFAMHGVRVHVIPEIFHFDFMQSLCVYKMLSLCITPNMTAVHGCGALGVPVWTFTPIRCAWRYGPVGEKPRHLPWYGDNVVQYHQVTYGSWDEVFQKMEEDFENLNFEGTKNAESLF